MARVTLADVAQKAGVSNWTVSVVLNQREEAERLSDECVERVRKAAREMGYLGNYHARTLARGKSMTLGFISRYNERDIMRPAIESGFTSEANKRGYEMLSISLPDGDEAIRRAARYVQQGRIDGFAVFSGVRPGTGIKDEIPPSIPLVHVWFHTGLLYPVVTIDPEPGMREAVEHLLELGHRRIAWLGMQREGRPVAPDRLEGVRKAANDLGIEALECFIPSTGVMRQHDSSCFYECVMDSPDLLGDATAVLCYNDAMAIGLCAALRERGLHVPGDVSVVGFDDVHAIHAVPRLTTVSHCFAQMGRVAVRHLFELIESGEDRTDTVIRVPARLIVRQSTAAPAARS